MKNWMRPEIEEADVRMTANGTTYAVSEGATYTTIYDTGVVVEYGITESVIEES